MRLLPCRHHRQRQGSARHKPLADARRHRRRPRRQYLPLRLAQPHHPRGAKSGGANAGRSTHMNAPLPGILADNPMLDRWVSFPAPGKITVNTGRVEIGQGVLTAMAQIAADELDVAMARITIRSGDTESHPQRRLHRRQPVDAVGRRRHAPGLRRRARAVPGAGRRHHRLPSKRADRERRQHPARRQADGTGLLDACRRGEPRGQGERQRAHASRFPSSSTSAKQRAPRSARQDFRQGHLHPRHAIARHGACARGAPAQSRRDHR